MPSIDHTIHFAALSPSARGLVTAGAIIVAGIVIGFIVDRVVVGSLRRLASITDAKLDDVIIGSLKNVARWVFFLIGVYIALPYLPISESIDHEVTIATRIVVLVMAIVITARFASGIAAHYAHRLLPSSVSLTKVIVNAIVFLIGLLVIFQTMGIQITPIIAALGVGGLAVALALQDTLANFFAGIQILALKQINPGDYVRLDTGQEGYVHDVGWRNAVLRVDTTNRVIVPNTKLAQAIVTNFSWGDSDVGVRIRLGVGYDSDLEKVERVLKDVAQGVVGRMGKTVKDFEPVVLFHNFGDSAIELDLIVRCSEFAEQVLVRHELIKAIHQRFAQEAIDIPFPMRTVVVKESRLPLSERRS